MKTIRLSKLVLRGVPCRFPIPFLESTGMKLFGMLRVIFAIGLLGWAGCSTPTISIHHSLPRAVPPPEGVTAFRVGNVTATPQSDADLTAYTAETLRQSLADEVNSSEMETASKIDVHLTAEVTDNVSQRMLRPAGGGELQALPSLVREATVSAEFHIIPPGGGEGVRCHSSAKYTSLADPRTRGELGLARADDPANVPPEETILRELVVECVEEFTGMIQPMEVRAEVPLRGSWASGAGEAIQQAGEGNYDAARAGFAQAVETHPDATLHFNLAALCEATGKLEEAREQYRLAAEARPDDTEAAEGLRRVDNVLRVTTWNAHPKPTDAENR